MRISSSGFFKLAQKKNFLGFQSNHIIKNSFTVTKDTSDGLVTRLTKLIIKTHLIGIMLNAIEMRAGNTCFNQLRYKLRSKNLFSPWSFASTLSLTRAG